MTYPYQAEIALEVARLHPGLTIVINHCGSPIDRDEPGMREAHGSVWLVVEAERGSELAQVFRLASE